MPSSWKLPLREISYSKYIKDTKVRSFHFFDGAFIFAQTLRGVQGKQISKRDDPWLFMRSRLSSARIFSALCDWRVAEAPQGSAARDVPHACNQGHRRGSARQRTSGYIHIIMGHLNIYENKPFWRGALYFLVHNCASCVSLGWSASTQRAGARTRLPLAPLIDFFSVNS